ncbi:MAG: MinD/ParA family protein [Lachnospiraceae bacterium]|jgi:flagellar biosynthesis protein FlhG|nr:MinD/ParA family protein [Lachnospiraceae bacterium]
MDQAEQLRKLVKQGGSQQKNLARVITVTSGKGGVGKSSISVNLAIELARMGKRVLIMDVDFGLANIEVMLGIRPEYNLADMMFRGKSLADIVIKGPEGIGFISGGSGIHELTSLTREQIVNLTMRLVELDEMADIVIIDTGAGIADAVLEFVSASTEVLLVATPEPTSITDAYALLKTLYRKSEFSAENTRIKVIANRVTAQNEGRELFEKINLVVKKFLKFGMEYLGDIPQDEQVSKAIIRQKPVVLSAPDSGAGKALRKLATKLAGASVPPPDERKGIAQLFGNLIRTTNWQKKKG